MFSLASFLVLAVTVVQGFTPLPPNTQLTTTTTSLHKTLKDLVDDAKDMVDDAVEGVENVFKRQELKQEILQLGASYDRGFGASPRVRNKVNKVIADLEWLNQENNASRFISGPEMVMNVTLTNTTSGNSTTMVPESKKETSPLTGNWRLIWTTASDVLILGANPFVTVGAIYQLIDPPIVTNVIDLLPRIQNLFPPSMVQGSLLRAKVQTRASKRPDHPMRIGLDFESVKLSPVELLGQDVGSLPPLGFDLPKLMELPDDVGYFDVTFLDDEMLIIRQNQPGGLFVLVKVEDTDP